MVQRRKGVKRRSLRVKSQDDGRATHRHPSAHHTYWVFAYNPRSVCWLDAFLALATRPLVVKAAAILSSAAPNSNLCTISDTCFDKEIEMDNCEKCGHINYQNLSKTLATVYT